MLLRGSSRREIGPLRRGIGCWAGLAKAWCWGLDRERGREKDEGKWQTEIDQRFPGALLYFLLMGAASTYMGFLFPFFFGVPPCWFLCRDEETQEEVKEYYMRSLSLSSIFPFDGGSKCIYGFSFPFLFSLYPSYFLCRDEVTQEEVKEFYMINICELFYIFLVAAVSIYMAFLFPFFLVCLRAAFCAVIK